MFTGAALAYLALFGLWETSMVTVSLLGAAAFLCVLIGIPLGIWFGKSQRAYNAALPVLDFMQTMPAFVYLIPIIAFFGTGKPPGVLATLVFGMPPVIRLTALGIRGVPESTKEAATAFGCTRWTLLKDIEIPLAMPSIMTGVNQTILMCLSMVVIASLIGAKGLGQDVLVALQYAAKGQGMLAGLAILFCAMVIDRIVREGPRTDRLHPVRPAPVSGDRWWRRRPLVSVVDERGTVLRLRASASASDGQSSAGRHARPMDALDKLAFSFPTMVRALLRLLPRALTVEFDLRTLQRLPTAHVGPGLRQRHADMPWRIACRRRAGHPPRPHVLLTLEFQATVDRHMALRVEIYTALLRQDLLREGHLVGPDRELPRVLPVVVHTGRERWSAPLSVRALTAPGPEAVTPLQPEARYVLLDGPALPDDDARRNLAAALIAVQSCVEAARMPERVAGLLGLLRRSGDEALGEALREAVRGILERRFGGELPRRWMEEPAMLEHRMDEWEQEWFRQGREEGRAEERALLRRQAARRFGADTAEALGRLLEGVDDADRLAEIGEMIVDCETGGELLDRAGRA